MIMTKRYKIRIIVYKNRNMREQYISQKCFKIKGHTYTSIHKTILKAADDLIITKCENHEQSLS